jgi:signal transduction histidine kinase
MPDDRIRPSAMGPRSERLRLVAAILATAVFAAVAAVAAGWPYWHRHGAFAAMNIADSVALLIAGVLLAGSDVSRRCGMLLILAGLCWSLTWAMSWDSGALPLVSGFAQSLFWLSFSWGLLIFRTDRFRSRLDRWWVAFAVVILIGGQTATTVTSRPEWNGFSAQVFWPSPLLLDRAGFDVVITVLLVCYVLLPATFIALALHRIRTLRGLERAVAAPVLLTAGVVALVAAATYPDLMSTPDLGRIEDAVALQGAASILAPCALLVVSVRSRLTVATTADRLLRAAHPPTAVGVRDSLRRALRDDTLRIFFYAPDRDCLVDLDGRPVAQPGDDGAVTDISGARVDRLNVQVRSPAGELLAVVSADPSLRRHRPLVDAALSAGSLALENAQLQSALHAQLVWLADAQRHIADVEAQERVRIERDLHDGVQQRLIALDMSVNAMEDTVNDPIASRALAEIRHGLGRAHQEVREIARGLHPPALAQDGLRHALEHVSGNLRLPAHLDIADTRFGAAAERAMFFALTEGLTNVAKHAEAHLVRIVVRAACDAVVGEVVDDGRGRAPFILGEGLNGATDRVRALGGSLEITSGPGRGTHLTVIVPCA